MTYRDAKTMTARGQIQLRYIKPAVSHLSVFQCLIVSSDAKRRAMFERAAAEGGWKTLVCSDAATALAHINRSFVDLGVVDLEGQVPDAFRPVVEQLTARSGLLLIVCGHEGDVEEEVWVRQLGAWLYLPGVVESSNFALLCGEARQIAERLRKTNGVERAASSPAQRKLHG